MAAVRAISAGDVAEAHFKTVGDDWDVEDRARETLARFGLPTGLDRTVGTLSGGEAVLAGVAGLLLRRAPITLLDEPTNNLDRAARELLYDAVRTWPGVLIVVSHDRDLLECVERIVELRDGTARTFGGTFSAYEQLLAAEQAAAERQVRAAEGELRRERRQQVQAQVTLARRRRFADTAEREKRVPKIVAHNRKREAQVSAGKFRAVHADRVDTAARGLTDAEAQLRTDARIRIDLPATAVPGGRTLVAHGELVIRGPERIALRGRERVGQDDAAAAVGAGGHRAGRLPAAAPGPARSGRERAGQRARGRAGGDPERGPGPARPIPAARASGGATGRHAVGG